MSPEDLAKLRNLLRPLIEELKSHTHMEISGICKELGMPEPPSASALTRIWRLRSSFDGVVSEPDVRRLAERLLLLRPPPPRKRNEIQDLLWGQGPPHVPKKVRQEIADAIRPEMILSDTRELEKVLERFWVLDEYRDDLGSTLREAIANSFFASPRTWSVSQLFSHIGALECSSLRFCRFFEELVSGDVQPDETQQQNVIATSNAKLKNCGLELQSVEQDGRNDIFRLVDISPQAKPVKQIIFGHHEKPDLRVKDVTAGDIEFASGEEKYLIYDRTITSQGLSWEEVCSWWFARSDQSQGMGEAKKRLVARLRSSLPENSPPQIALFDTYVNMCKNRPHLPALLPEVWLHWDPKTYAERGVDAMLRMRMDFLMLLPKRLRIVIEVDGAQHYSVTVKGQQIASPETYAKMAAADREIKLAGYEVYHFGGAELSTNKDQQAVKTTVEDFFLQLFARHGLKL